MSSPEYALLLSGGSYFEAPRWRDGHWYVSDVYAGQVRRVSAGGDSAVILRHDGPVSGLGWLPDGRLLAVAMRDKTVLALAADGGTSEFADLKGDVRGELNDMVVDADGNAYVGAVGFDLLAGEPPQPAVVTLIRPDGATAVAADGLMFPNGSVVTDDGSTLIVAETFGGALTAFDIGRDGSLSGRRPWASLPTGVLPDGIGLDGEGLVWVADAASGRILHVAQGGEVRRELDPPDGLKAFAVAVGGPDRKSLLVCAAPDFDPAARLANAEAQLFTLDLDRL